MARRSKYTPETIKSLTDSISVGMTDGDACIIAGISQETFYLWQRTKPEFLHQTTRARSEGWRTALAMLKRGALNGDVRAIEAYLDRTHSPYRKTTDVNVTVQIRKRAEEMAAQLGITADELIAEAEAVAAGAWDTWSHEQ